MFNTVVALNMSAGSCNIFRYYSFAFTFNWMRRNLWPVYCTCVCSWLCLCPRHMQTPKSPCAPGWCRCATLFIAGQMPLCCSSTCECLMTLSLTCCWAWWPRSGSWICLSCSSLSTGACRTLNYSPNSNRFLAKGSLRLPWQQEPGSSLVESTQVKYSTYTHKL